MAAVTVRIEVQEILAILGAHGIAVPEPDETLLIDLDGLLDDFSTDEYGAGYDAGWSEGYDEGGYDAQANEDE